MPLTIRLTKIGSPEVLRAAEIDAVTRGPREVVIEHQKEKVMGLVEEIGFDPVDGGTLDESWQQQPSTPSYCCDWDAKTMRKALAAAVEGEALRKRAQLPEQFAALGSNPTHADSIALNRSLNWPT